MLNTIGSRIAFFRKARNLGRRELADIVGCTPAYVGALERWEKRYRNPTIDSLQAFSKALGIHLFHLLDDAHDSAASKRLPDIDSKTYMKMKIGERIKAAREWQNHSLKTFSDKCEIPINDLKTIEKIDIVPFVRLHRIALELGISPYWLSPEPVKFVPAEEQSGPPKIQHIQAILRELPIEQKRKLLLSVVKELTNPSL